jgi:pyruvate/2-oxoglutarate dehydrogenase complex dihydrolipoamide dehydrogenase (E3) component
MAEVLTPDICVIGAGSGGLTVAAAVAAFGVPVVLIERGRMGGDCLNYGCVPSKALLAAGKHVAAYGHAPAFGVAVTHPIVNFARVHSHVKGVIAAIAPNDSKERFTGLGVRVIEGEARFRDAATVVVGDIEIKARRVVIATGSSPALPPIPGLAETPHFTNETIFELTACPAHLVVIGGGPIGLELAQAHRRLGAAVTVLEAAQPLAKDDPECAAVVLDALAREGVVVRAGVKIARVEPDADKVRVVLDDGEAIAASHLLVATGRSPNVAGLDLDAARIKHGPRGIVVDKRLRTSNRRVYAIGDVAGGRFTHEANYHAGLVVRHALFRLPVRANPEAVPWVTFTDPEFAHVGLTEVEAKKRHRTIRVLRWPYHENDRAQAERETHGHIKLVTGKRGHILGVTIVGRNAGEMITTWTLAISQNLTVRALMGIVVPYPTLSEIGKRAAISFYLRSAASVTVRKIITLLRRFG